MNEDQEIKIGLTCSDDANNSEIPSSSEWKNGDACIYTHPSYRMNPNMIYVGKHPSIVGTHICISELLGIVYVNDSYLEKSKTQEQREERERLEAAYDLYCLKCDAIEWKNKYSFDEFQKENNAVNGWLAVVDKTNYRLTK